MHSGQYLQGPHEQDLTNTGFWSPIGMVKKKASNPECTLTRVRSSFGGSVPYTEEQEREGIG